MSTTNRPRLVALPAMPSAARAKSFASCECGCGGQTQARFVPGHDSRLRGWVIRVARGVVTLDWIRQHVSAGEAAAVAGAIEARRLHGIDWDELFPVAVDEQVG